MALRSHYDQAKLTSNEILRVKYIRELATLRTKFEETAQISHDYTARDAVEWEMARYPAPANADSKALSKALIDRWRSPRHDYLYRADGTWIMLPAPPCTTHGYWTIKGNQEIEDWGSPPSTIILINKDYFILAGGQNGVYYESRVVDGVK
jgi:hypothetical protein